MAPRVPPRGIYVPAVAFFDAHENIDLPAIEKHLRRLASAQVQGLVIQGTNGEAMHMLHSERQDVIRLARRVLAEDGRPDAVLVAGCGAQSTRETVQLCEEAKEAGADYALVLTPSYFVGAMQKPTIYKFFDDVASASPIPIILYNFPAVTGGIDLDSDLISNLASANKNIVGVKLTCGNMGKLQRLAHDPRLSSDGGFAAFAGKTDFMLPGLVCGSHGVIAATANLIPRLHVEMLKLYDAGQIKEARELQTKFSRADWALVQLGIAGIKGALQRYYGYGGGSRRPLADVDVKRFEGQADEAIQAVLELENNL